MGRQHDRRHAQREAALSEMAAQATLPARDEGERHGHYFRRCALVWLDGALGHDQRLVEQVMRLVKPGA